MASVIIKTVLSDKLHKQSSLPHTFSISLSASQQVIIRKIFTISGHQFICFKTNMQQCISDINIYNVATEQAL